jgi:hypothetical protein
MGFILLQPVLSGFMNNILSGTKYRVCREGVSLIHLWACEKLPFTGMTADFPLKPESFLQDGDWFV